MTIPVKKSRATNLRKPLPGRVQCTVDDCPQPLGNQNKGFTKQGLTNHSNKLHKVNYTPLEATVVVEAVQEGLVADSQRFIDDIKNVVDSDWEYNEYVTPRLDADGNVDGWWVRGRNACCAWTAKGKGYEHGVARKTGEPYRCKGYFVTIDANKAGATYAPEQATQSNGPVGSSTEKGAGTIVLKARRGRLFVKLDNDWEEYDLEKFIGHIRFAVRIS